jgi:nitrogen fixation/metabolism regulation signal transduction histidine kinase
VDSLQGGANACRGTAGRGFSGVVDNLIRNAAEKHLLEPAVRVDVELKRNDAGFELVVCDNGSAMADSVASSLFLGPGVLRERLRDRAL